MKYTDPKSTLVMDSEVYKNYYLVMFRNVDSTITRHFELYEGRDLGERAIRGILARHRIVTFNGRNYDMPILALALTGGTCKQLREMSDAIILNGLKGWQAEDRWNVRLQDVDHIDLFEVAPGQCSLKIYGGRMHTRKMQDLPIEPDALIIPEQRPVLIDYCGNDLVGTAELYATLKPQIELREKMSDEYGEDLRSKSDAQIAEAVIKRSLHVLTGEKPTRPADWEQDKTFHYKAPEFVSFKTPALRDTLVMIEASPFLAKSTGKILMPEALQDHRIKLGGSVYRMGIGGLHSSETCVVHVADDKTVVIDRDVASYYPAIILGCELYPKHLGRDFLEVYRGIVERRLAAKRAGNKVMAEALKITVNGSFGKFGNIWSTLYSPELLIQTTITGQLALLMLIEMLEDAGIPVVSANTDGVVMKCPRSRQAAADGVVGTWELVTGFTTEQTLYKGLYARDVNNYIALKDGGGVKLKGAYAPAGIGPPTAGPTGKNPSTEICTEAAIKYLQDDTPVGETIRACQDVRKFVSIRTVKGGAVKDGKYLGRAVRWYYARGVAGAIEYKVNGYKVPKTDGARPLMELPDALPSDVDFQWYEQEALNILSDIGVGFGLC